MVRCYRVEILRVVSVCREWKFRRKIFAYEEFLLNQHSLIAPVLRFSKSVKRRINHSCVRITELCRKWPVLSIIYRNVGLSLYRYQGFAVCSGWIYRIQAVIPFVQNENCMRVFGCRVYFWDGDGLYISLCMILVWNRCTGSIKKKSIFFRAQFIILNPQKI